MRKITYFKMILLAVILVVGSVNVTGQTSYNWDGSSTSSNTGSNPNIISAAFGSTQGNNNGTLSLISTTSASSGYSGYTGGSNFGAACKTGVLNTGTSTYFTVVITPTANYQISLNSISLGSRSTGTGPAAITVYSDIDNYTTPIGSATVLANSTWALSSINFSGISLKGATSTAVTLRIYGSNGAGTVGSSANWRIDDISLSLTASLSGSTAAAIPTFLPAPGTYTSAQSVTLSSATSGALIYYTTDGVTTPSSASTLYSGAIPLNSSATTTIQAIAYDASNANPSSVASATYVINLNPAITVTETTVPALTAQVGGTPSTQTIHVSGVNLTDVINIATNDPEFTVSPTSITPTSGTVTSTAVTITYTPTAAGSLTKTLTISSAGAADLTRSLSGTATLKAPVATIATGIGNTGFAANWGTVSGATSYQLNVYTKSAGPFNESFAGFAAGANGSGADGTEVSGSLDTYTMTPGWTGAKVYQAGGEAKMGTSSALGSMTTPSLDLSGNGGSFNVSFKSMAWSGDATSLKIYLDDVLVSAVTGLNNDATYTLGSFSVDLTGGTSTSKIRFEGSVASKGRFFLKDVLVSQGGFTKTNITGAPFTVSGSTVQQVSGLNSGANFYYNVVASDGTNNSFPSNEISVTTLPLVISAVSNSSTLPDCPTCDLTVANGGTLTVDAAKTFNTVTVEGGGKLNTLPGKPLTVGTVILKAGKDGTSFSSKLEADITAGTVRYLKTIDDAKWYFLSFPCDVAVANITKSDGTSLGTLGTDWFIKYYDGLQRATIGVVDGNPNWKDFTGTTLAATQGYIVGLKTGIPETEILFPLTTDIVKAESAKTIPVHSYAGAGGAPNNSGWNLVGQPYLSKYAAQGSSNAPYMLLSDGISTYSVYSSALSQLPMINPFDAYFVQANAGLESSALTFGLGGRQNVPVSVASNTTESVKLNVTTSTGADNTCLILDNEQSTAYQIGKDLEKWIGIGTDKPQIYTVLEGINYAFNALPVNSVANLPVGFYTRTTGPATISVDASQAPGLSALMLTDITTGTSTNLLTSDYTFTGTAGTDNARFVITAQRIATGNTIQTEQGGPTVISTDAGLILNNLAVNSTVRMYDAFGRLVVTKAANNSSLEVPRLPVGVYVIQIKSDTKNWVIKFVNKR